MITNLYKIFWLNKKWTSTSIFVGLFFLSIVYWFFKYALMYYFYSDTDTRSLLNFKYLNIEETGYLVSILGLLGVLSLYALFEEVVFRLPLYFVYKSSKINTYLKYTMFLFSSFLFSTIHFFYKLSYFEYFNIFLSGLLFTFVFFYFGANQGRLLRGLLAATIFHLTHNIVHILSTLYFIGNPV
jgi:hypothetical protein